MKLFQLYLNYIYIKKSFIHLKEIVHFNYVCQTSKLITVEDV